jgi:Protein of unknown function (DUF4239)
MPSLALAFIIFAVVFGGAIVGILLRRFLPANHLAPESKDVIKVGAGLIGTMAALVLGLLLASAKGSYDAQKSQFTQMSVKIAVLDRALAHYGPEAKDCRETLRVVVARMLGQIWPENGSGHAQLDPRAARGDVLYDKLVELTPKTEAQKYIHGLALNLAVDLAQMRWLLFQQSASAISTPFLVVVVFWLGIIFASFGLFAPANATTIVTLMLCAASVAGALFLILELDRPFDGMIQIPSAPLRNALDPLGP